MCTQVYPCENSVKMVVYHCDSADVDTVMKAAGIVVKSLSSLLQFQHAED